MKNLISLTFILVSIFGWCHGAKILCIFPTASFSHQQPLLAVSRALAAKGHDLTVINTNPSPTPLKNHRDINLNFLYKEWDNLRKEKGLSLQERGSPYKMIRDLPEFMHFFAPLVLDSPQLKDLIREINGTKYDLIIYESIIGVYSSYLGLSELVGNPPMVGMITMHTYAANDLSLGNPILPSYIPNNFLPYGHLMTFTQRVNNFLIEAFSLYMDKWFIKPAAEFYKKKHFGDGKHTALDLENNISLLIVSADLATGYPKPVHPNTIYVGPMHINPKPDPLPEDIQKWMDESEEGVIYFSMGSNMKGTSVAEDKRAAFIKAFSQFPRVRVLWKWEADTKLPGQPDNVLVKKWLPQQPILAHPKLRLFISQCGLQSFQEATHFGVPILGIPMFADQDFNAAKLQNSGTGRQLEFNDITYDTVYEHLKQLLTDKSYKENMMRVSRITKDKPMPALETAVWWIEYVLRHDGAPHLRPAALDLTWYQYYSLDVIGTFLAAIFGSIYLAYYTIKKLLIKGTKIKLKKN